MPSNIADVLAVAAMHVKYDKPEDAAGIPFDATGQIMTIEMMAPGGTIDKFSLVNTGKDWLLANEHTLVCPMSFSGLLARAAFHYTRNLALSYELSDYAGVLDAEFPDATKWDEVISKILAVTVVAEFLLNNAAADNTRLPAITSDGVTDDLAQKVKDAVAVWARDTPRLESRFPLAGLPYVLQELQTSKESAERVFPFDREAARRLLLSLGRAVDSKTELQRLVRIATDYRLRESAGTMTTLNFSTGDRARLELLFKYVLAFGTLPSEIVNSVDIDEANVNVAKKTDGVDLATEATLKQVVDDFKNILQI